MSPLLSVVQSTKGLVYTLDASNQNVSYNPVEKAVTISLVYSGNKRPPPSPPPAVVYDGDDGDVVGFQLAGETVIFTGYYPFGATYVPFFNGNVVCCAWTYSETEAASLLMSQNFLFTIDASSYDMKKHTITVTVTDIRFQLGYFQNNTSASISAMLCNNSVACIRTGVSALVSPILYVRSFLPISDILRPPTVLTFYSFPTAVDVDNLMALETYFPLLRGGAAICLDGLYVLNPNLTINKGAMGILAANKPICINITACLETPLTESDGTPIKTLTAVLYDAVTYANFGFAYNNNPIMSTLSSLFPTQSHYESIPVIGTYTIRISKTEQYEADLRCTVQDDLSLSLVLKVRNTSDESSATHCDVQNDVCTRPWFYGKTRHGLQSLQSRWCR